MMQYDGSIPTSIDGGTPSMMRPVSGEFLTGSRGVAAANSGGR
jgi:hypothetical protein